MTGTVQEPAGLSAWRQRRDALVRPTPPTPHQVASVLSSVREGRALNVTARRAQLTVGDVLDVVVGVGSRISQANKKGLKADLALSLADAASQGLDDAGIHGVDGRLVVVLGPGWERTAAHGRDIGRAYAAVTLADPGSDERPVERWLATLAQQQPLTYGHFSHLYAVASGGLLPLDGISDDLDVQDAYLRAFDLLAASIAEASDAVHDLAGLVTAPPPQVPARAMAALRRCFWLLPNAHGMAALARAAEAGDPKAAQQLRVALSGIRSALAAAPRRFTPRSLGDLTGRQFAAVTALHGFHATDMEDSVRVDKDLGDLASTVQAIRAQMAGGTSLESAVETVTTLSQQWQGAA